MASLNIREGECTKDVLESGFVLQAACRRLALEHPLAKGRVDPAFAYVITHPNVDWAHSGLYKEHLLQRLTVADETERQELWNAAVDEYIAKGTDQRPVEEVRVLGYGCIYASSWQGRAGKERVGAYSSRGGGCALYIIL